MLPTHLHHHEQGWPNSCVPACIGIVRKWRGQPFDEGALHAGAGPKGHPLYSAIPHVGGERHTPEPAEFLARAPLWFAEGKALLVTVFGPVYVKRMGTKPGRFSSQHGDLCSAGSRAIPLHALVLIGLVDEDFLVLDPYYPAAGQPLRIPQDYMLEMFACDLIVCG